MGLLATFIGVDQFADPSIRDLTGCRRDATALWALFSDTIPEIQADLVLDDAATAAGIRAALDASLGRVTPNDTVIVSFSGHGTKDHRLVAHDTVLTRHADTSIDMGELAKRFRDSRAKAVLCILDCCFSGGAPARVLDATPTTRSPGLALNEVAGEGRILIAASNVNEEALENDRHGLLTRAILNALQEGEPPINVTAMMAKVVDQDLSTTSSRLRDCLSGGTAFHNTHLSREERAVIEQAFRSRGGPVKVLAATTTVAAGINTPASTVVLAEMEFVGDKNQPYSVAEYKNMAGRAGRLGYNEQGRAIILADTRVEREALFRQYVVGKLEPMTSSFAPDQLSTWLLRLFAQSDRVPAQGAVRLLASTYGGYLAGRADPQWKARAEQQLSRVMDQMMKLGLVEEDAGFVRLSLLGRACGRSALSFDSAIRLVRMIRAAGQSIGVEQLAVLIQALPELDGVYTPVAKRGSAESRWPLEVSGRFGQPTARALQQAVADQTAYLARCKRAMIVQSWLDGVRIEQIERVASVNPFNAVGSGHIRQFADAVRFHVRSAFEIATAMLAVESLAADELDALLRRLEVGLPADALGLLDLEMALTRGDYLALRQAGARTPEEVWALAPDALEKALGRRTAARFAKMGPAPAMSAS